MPNWKKIIVSGSDASLSSLHIDGNLTASAAYLTSASIGHLETIYETASVIYSSGSTKFGDTLDDTHEITGSLLVTGSITLIDNGTGSFGRVEATTIDLDRLSLTSTQTTVPPLQLTANSLLDGVGALRIDGSQADIFLNPSTATHTTVTFAVNNDQKLAFGMDNNTDFYITRRDGGTWYDNTFTLSRTTGKLTLEGDLQAANITGSEISASLIGTASIADLATTASHTAGTASIANNSTTSSYTLTGDGIFSGSFNGDGSSLYENITVTVVNDGGNKYAFNGITAPYLSLQRPSFYRFDLSDSSNSGHPFAFRLPDDTSYTIGVTTVGTAGNAGAYVELDIDFNASSSLKYYCTVHGNGMGNDIQVNDLFDLRASGSFSGSFEGDGSNLTGVASPTGSYTGSFTGSILGDVIGTASIADLATTASYISTASFADSATTASQADNATTASHIVTASFADSTTTASIADSLSQLATASHALTSVTSSHTAGTASFANLATTASHVVTASFADNATTASFPERGFIDGTVNNNIITLNRGDGSSIDLETTVSGSVESASIASVATTVRNGGSGSFSGSFQGDGSNITGISPFPFTGSGEMQGSLTVESFNEYVDDYAEDYFAGIAINASGDVTITGSIFSPYINADQFTGSFSGSLSGSFTGSFGGTADSASHAETASFYGGSVTSASLAETASFVETAQTASFVETSQTASHALVTSQSVNNNASSGSLSFWQGSLTEYNAISASADNNTVYFVTE